MHAFGIVTDWWQSHGYKLSIAGSTAAVFNLSEARNLAVEQATTELVIVADADTVPGNQNLLIDENAITYPFETYRYLGNHKPTIEQLPTSEYELDNLGSTGGMLTTSKTTYFGIGGMDENFTQWGWEDRAFWLAANTLARSQRTAGIVYAYGHDAARDMTENNPGYQRWQLYREANGNPDMMRELTNAYRSNRTHVTA